MREATFLATTFTCMAVLALGSCRLREPPSAQSIPVAQTGLELRLRSGMPEHPPAESHFMDLSSNARVLQLEFNGLDTKEWADWLANTEAFDKAEIVISFDGEEHAMTFEEFRWRISGPYAFNCNQFVEGCRDE